MNSDDNKPNIINQELFKDAQIISLIGFSYGIGFLSGYFYATVGFFDLIILAIIGTISYNISSIRDAYYSYKSNINDNSKNDIYNFVIYHYNYIKNHIGIKNEENFR